MNKEWRIEQILKVTSQYIEYKPKIKIIKPDGETEWITITEKELRDIISVLAGKDGLEKYEKEGG